MGHQQVTAGEPINGRPLIWAFGFTNILLLTAWKKALRLAWTRQQRQWKIDNRKHVACPGKSRFQLHRIDGSVQVRREPYGSMDHTYQ